MNASNIASQAQNCDIDFYDDRAEWEAIFRAGTLSASEHPAFSRYCLLFYDYCSKSPYHVKRSYKTGFIAKKKVYKNKNGEYYAHCMRGLVERHLDYYDRRPFWLGLRFGKKSSVLCLDFDNKPNILGSYKARQDWMPAVHLPLDHFRRMKRLYDAFPNHIWCVSSATLGLHVWQRLSYPHTSAAVEWKTRPNLVRIGLGDLEVYPSPKLRSQVLRRPFGMDYYTITNDGLLTFWDEQLEHFETATRAPSFRVIVRSLVALARVGWQSVRNGSKFLCKEVNPFASKRSLNDRLLESEAERVLAWVDAGCPDEEPNSADPFSSTDGDPQHAVDLVASTPRSTRRSVSGDSPIWSWRKVTDLARHGVPEEHKLYKYLLWLARPLVWRDYYHLPEGERVRKAEDDLLFWVLNKHNGLVTRVQTGQIDNINHEIRHQVWVAMNKTDKRLRQFYERMREKDRLHPKRVERLPDLIRANPCSFLGCCERRYVKDLQTSAPEGGPDEASCTTTEEETPSSFLGCCMRYIKEPDDTPLPAEVLQKLEQIVKDKRMRRKDGEYPLLRFARRLLNALWAEDGAAEIHGDILRDLCGSQNRAQVVGYKMLMAKADLISDQWEGHAQPGVSSAVYQMTDETFARFQQHHGTAKTKKRVKSPFTITAMTEAKLDTTGFGW